MNRGTHDSHHHRPYRDSERGLILGVCAGLADHFGCPAWLVRVIAVVLAWFLTIPAIVAYIVAALLMPERPLRYHGYGDERTFWQSRTHRS